MTSNSTTLTKKIALLSGSVVLGAFMLSGCSSASMDGATSEPTMSVKDAIATMGTIDQEQIEYDGKFNSCLEGRGASGAGQDSLSADNKDANEAACAEEVGDLPQPSEKQKVALRTWTKALHSCLAQKGHKIPDLKADGQWDNDTMKELQKTDTTLNSDSETCFTEVAE